MKIIRIDSVDSTNLYAKRISNEIEENVLIIANDQTKGYGTKNRKWYSNKDSIICSFLLKNKKNIPLDYSYRIGTIISNVINKICNVNTYVKKPNDIYLNNKKIGGILIETQYLLNNINFTIIGIGLNINQKEFPDDIANIATSLFMETKNIYDNEEIINGLIKEIEREE